MHGVHLPVNTHAEARGRMVNVFLYHSLPHCLEAGSLTEPELSILPRPAGPQAAGTHLSLSSDNAGLAPLTPCMAFSRAPRIPTQVFMFSEVALLPSGSSPQLQGCLSNPLLVEKPCRFSIAYSPQTNFFKEP